VLTCHSLHKQPRFRVAVKQFGEFSVDDIEPIKRLNVLLDSPLQT